MNDKHELAPQLPPQRLAGRWLRPLPILLLLGVILIFTGHGAVALATSILQRPIESGTAVEPTRREQDEQMAAAVESIEQEPEAVEPTSGWQRVEAA